MNTPDFEVALGFEGQPWGDHDYLSLLREMVRETKATIAQSRASIDWTRDAIALLDRLSAKQRPSIS
jgi:hypothetical protein